MTDRGNLFYAGFLGFVLLLLWKDMSVSTTNEKQIPITKVGQISSSIGPTLKVLYCYSCGYRNLFERYSEILREKYPELLIQGSNYEPSGYKLFIARFINFAKMILLASIIFGWNIFQKMGLDSPPWWNWLLENKLYSCIMIFFLCNAIEGHLISTGAFEILINDMPVWSKLETGRTPDPPELFQIINNHLMMEPSPPDAEFPK